MRAIDLTGGTDIVGGAACWEAFQPDGWARLDGQGKQVWGPADVGSATTK
jgi:hypothetical protein